MVRRYFLAAWALLAISGCAGQTAGLQSEPIATLRDWDPKAPLVLAIPGLNVPGAIPQEQHFGNLVRMLAEQGIPARVLAYDTPENPLTRVASLAFNETNIATTRVGPAVVNEIQSEKERRADECLPPLKEVVLFSYSQGGVIANRIAVGIYLFKQKYRDFCRQYGAEWPVLMNDPEFVYLINALEDFLVAREMKVQREKDFENDPDLRSFYRRSRKKLDRRTKEFLRYLKDTRSTYPHFALCAEECFKDLQNYGDLKQFFVDYAQYRDLLDIHFRYVSTAGSYFGSPVASQTYGLIQLLPFLEPFIGSQLRQIQDTRLGSSHQTKDAEDLLELKRRGHYPYPVEDTLFVVGANGDKGDGLVDQSSAHLADHALGFLKLEGQKSEQKRVQIIVDKLPDRVVVPLRFKHFPEAGLFGQSYGAAYMVPDNPVFPYLVAFIRKDWKTIRILLDQSDIRLQQFMIELVFSDPQGGHNLPLKMIHSSQFENSRQRILNPSFRRKAISEGIRINREYSNPQSDTFVWTGTFMGQDQRMNLGTAEDDSGFVTFELQRGNAERITLDIPVYPGCNTLIKIDG